MKDLTGFWRFGICQIPLTLGGACERRWCIDGRLYLFDYSDLGNRRAPNRVDMTLVSRICILSKFLMPFCSILHAFTHASDSNMIRAAAQVL